jgi:hypothetical protein
MKRPPFAGHELRLNNAVMPEEAAFFYFNQRVSSFLVRNPG